MLISCSTLLKYQEIVLLFWVDNSSFVLYQNSFRNNWNEITNFYSYPDVMMLLNSEHFYTLWFCNSFIHRTKGMLQKLSRLLMLHNTKHLLNHCHYLLIKWPTLYGYWTVLRMGTVTTLLMNLVNFVHSADVFLMLSVIWYQLCSLKNVRNTRWKVPMRFFTFFKLYKWYQVAQSV